MVPIIRDVNESNWFITTYYVNKNNVGINASLQKRCYNSCKHT